jgi:hypothetical protein
MMGGPERAQHTIGVTGRRRSIATLARSGKRPDRAGNIPADTRIRRPDVGDRCLGPEVGLAHAFDMTTVSEGVETQAQLDYLVHAGCDESQGFLHSRPISKLEFEHLLGVSRPAQASALITYINADTPASRTRRA